MAPPIIAIEALRKVYRMGGEEIAAVEDVDLAVDPGEFVAIMGPSGSGKSTLMNIIGCLDQPTDGRYLLDGEDVGALSDNQLARLRNQKLGFVFQSFNLLPRTTALENVALPLLYGGVGSGDRARRAGDALRAVGLENRMGHRPNELSGGQRQRVAIARALVNDPGVILADEPTGNLDSRVSEEIMLIFRELNETRGITIVLVTHEDDIALHARRRIRMLDGRLASDERRSGPTWPQWPADLPALPDIEQRRPTGASPALSSTEPVRRSLPS